MRRFCAVLLTVFALVSVGFSQHPQKAVKAYNAAEEAYHKGDYEKAHQQLLKAVMTDPNYAEAWLLDGEVGMEMKDHDLALIGYENAMAIDSMLFPPAAIVLARLYDESGSYHKEILLLNWYKKRAKGNAYNDNTVDELLAQATFRDDAMKHPKNVELENMGKTINTGNDEYVNMLSFDGSMLLFTRKMPMGNGTQQEFLFYSLWDDEKWSEAQGLTFASRPDDVDFGAAFISADGRKLYITGCGLTRNSSCDIYVSEWGDGQWSRPQRLSESVNTGSWESQPCVSSDGKELFFVSRRSGNADIYRCWRNADGTWGEPQNLGEPINTTGTEMAPFLHPDGHTLYFSSDKHLGMGGFDLFMSRRDDNGQWQTPVNLGFPINTHGDEINFFVAADGKTAFISSQREEGNGGYDIYTFELPEEIRSDSANYLATVNVTELTPGDAVILQNIQFEYNSAALTEDSQMGIQMLTDFLSRNPKLKVELAGHTDDVGSATYNLKLSSERAEVVRVALIDMGIEEGRLTAKGYGATKPLISNDSEEHRAMNRRTEMIIID